MLVEKRYDMWMFRVHLTKSWCMPTLLHSDQLYCDQLSFRPPHVKAPRPALLGEVAVGGCY